MLLALALLATNTQASEAVWIEGEHDTISSTFNQHNWYSAVRGELLSPGSPDDVDHPGAWRAHFANDTSPAEATWQTSVTEGGDYTLWARVGAYRINMWARVDGGAAVDLDLDHTARETINLVEPTLDVRYLAWAKVAEVTLTPGTHTVTFGLRNHPAYPTGPTYGGVDAFVLTNVPRWAPTGALRPDTDGLDEGTPEGWYPFLPTNDPFDGGSALDVSSTIEKPAGARGRPHRDGDAFVLADGTPIRFWGTNVGGVPGTPALREQQARFWAKMGINAVRLHSAQSWLGYGRNADGSPAFDAERLDALDHWIAALKAQGIYVDLSVFYPFVIQPGDGTDPLLDAELPASHGGKSASGIATFREDVQAAETRWLTTLLAHENPYTGTTYAEEPAIAMLELRNEDSIFWHAPLNQLWDGTYPRHLALLQARWAAWLRTRYPDDDALLAAWGPAWAGSRPGDSLSNEAMYIYAAWEMGADGATTNPAEQRRVGDWIRFLAETQAEGYRRRADALRDVGFDGILVSSAWMAGGAAASVANLWTDASLDAIDRHAYVGGGIGDWRILPGEVNAWSHFDHPGEGLLAEGLYQVADTPFVMTEWATVLPDPFRYEAPMIQALYGMGLQGWDGLFAFTSSAAWWGTGWPGLASFSWDTPQTLGLSPALSLAVREGHLSAGDVVAARTFDEDDVFSGTDARTHVAGANVPGIALLQGRVTTGFGATSEVAGGGSSASGAIASLHGELLWDTEGRFARVDTPRTQGVFGFFGGRTHTLGDATITLRTDSGALLLTALDGLPLAESARILLTAVARDRQTGATYSAGDTVLDATGGPPLLLEPVQADLVLGGAPLVRVSALTADGAPQFDVPVADNAFTIDGRWRSSWYLLERAATPVDTGIDTAGSVDTGDDKSSTEGCGCANGSALPTWTLTALATLALVRRRRR